MSIVERYLIQCPLFGVSVKRESTVPPMEGYICWDLRRHKITFPLHNVTANCLKRCLQEGKMYLISDQWHGRLTLSVRSEVRETISRVYKIKIMVCTVGDFGVKQLVDQEN